MTRSAVAGIAVTAALAFSAAIPATAGTADRSGTARPPVARVWLTTVDGTQRLTDAGTVPFSSAAPTDLTVTVDPSRSYQSMQGFGAALTDSSAAVLYRLDPAARRAAMASLFDPHTGDGLSYLRVPMGASDFVAERHYTYDDLPAGETDYPMRHFSIDHDRTQILPLLREARRLNPRLRILASPWSPPAWMKTNGSLIGGRLIDDPAIYRAYATYFVKFLQEYARAGVPVDAVTLQNEPQNRTPSGYPGTDLPVAQETQLIKTLGPALRRAGLRTDILAYDHNWVEHPGDVAGTPPGSDPEEDYAAQVLSDPDAARWVSGTAFHCYYGDPSAQTKLHEQFPDKDIYFTECSGSKSADPASTFSDTLKWHSRNLVIGTTRNWSRTVVNWNLALDPAGGPHVGGCDTCTGVLTVGPDQAVTRNAEYYTLGHLSRFVRPGAVRVASTSFGTTGWNGQIMDVAFRNPDGSLVLVAHNENDDPRRFAVAVGDKAFSYTLPGGALATFTWPGSLGSPRLLPASGQVATAEPPAPADPCCSGDVAANAVDDDATTRWSTGAAQQPGQYLQVDLGRAGSVERLVLDTGAGVGDYPRAYQVSVSRDGLRWSNPVAGTGSGQLTAIDLPDRPLRFVRVTLTAAASSWWSVADVRVYR
jgi:glucosylceramidase